MAKRRVTLFIDTTGEPDNDSELALHVAEALLNRFRGIGPMSTKAFTPGPAVTNCVTIAVGVTKMAQVRYESGSGFVIEQLSSDKHG